MRWAGHQTVGELRRKQAYLPFRERLEHPPEGDELGDRQSRRGDVDDRSQSRGSRRPADLDGERVEGDHGQPPDNLAMQTTR
jgi:hypothetical protein